MGAPYKQGLDYFSFDVDFFNNEKIIAISGEFGIKGEIVAIKLLCAVYENGYFAVWSELFQMKLLKSINGINIELLNQIVNRLVKWEFFDKDLFNSDMVLTSINIQKRFIEATKKRKRIDTSKYWLLGNEIKSKCRNNDGINVVNDGINSQSKVKERKNYNKKDFFDFRKKIFDALPSETKQRFSKYGINKPLIRENDNIHNLYNDVVEVLLEAENDKEWQYRFKQSHNLTDYKFSLYFSEFVKIYISDDTNTYNINGFKRHFLNWFKKYKS